MTRSLSALVLVAGLTACASGASAPVPVPVAPTQSPVPGPVASVSPAPVLSPTPAPSNAPTASPTIAPTATPAPTPVPLALRVIGGAPLSATASQLANARRTAQAQGVTNGLPILVESSGMVAAWAGDMTTWVSAQATAQDVPETGMTVTPSGTLALNNPAPAQSCLGSLAAACIAHPTAFTWGTSSTNGKPVGKQTLTVAFADGTTGTTFDAVYDGWALQCNTGFVYQGGIPVATATRNASDVYADCAAGNIVFPQGGILAFNPVQDQFGRYETIMPTITSAILISSFITNVPMAATAVGQVYGIATKDGGFAKVYMSVNAIVTPVNPPGLISAEGMSLHAKPDSTYAF